MCHFLQSLLYGIQSIFTDSAFGITLTFPLWRKPFVSRWKWLLITHDFPTFYRWFASCQLPLFPRLAQRNHTLPFLLWTARVKQTRERRKTRDRRKRLMQSYLSASPVSPPRALLAWTPHSKTPGEGGKGNAHYSMYPFCTQWKGMACDIPFNSSRVSMAKSLPVRWCWARERISSLFGPVSWRGIELPSGVWNRSICLNQSSCRHVEMLWPSKDTTCNMDETCPQSNDAIFFLSFNK